MRSSSFPTKAQTVRHHYHILPIFYRKAVLLPCYCVTCITIGSPPPEGHGGPRSLEKSQEILLFALKHFVNALAGSSVYSPSDSTDTSTHPSQVLLSEKASSKVTTAKQVQVPGFVKRFKCSHFTFRSGHAPAFSRSLGGVETLPDRRPTRYLHFSVTRLFDG